MAKYLILFFGVLALAQTDRPCSFQVIAGPHTTSPDGGPASSAWLLGPTGISAGPDGILFIADTQNHRIRTVRPDGTIATIAGTGISGYSGDGGNAIDATLSAPQGVLATADGSVYISDTGNHRIRRIAPDGTITLFAGAHSGFSGDGQPAILAEISVPTALAAGPDGSIYFADTGNNRIRRVDPAGIISTVAGTQNGKPLSTTSSVAPQDPCCYSGDGGPATAARLNGPNGIAVSADGTIYVMDAGNWVIRKIDTSGIITTIAGTLDFAKGSQYPLPAAQAYVAGNDLSLLPDGSLLIGTRDVLKMTPDGMVSRIATSYLLNNTAASNLVVAADLNGSIYASDAPLNVVWKIGVQKELRGAAQGDRQVFHPRLSAFQRYPADRGAGESRRPARDTICLLRRAAGHGWLRLLPHPGNSLRLRNLEEPRNSFIVQRCSPAAGVMHHRPSRGRRPSTGRASPGSSWRGCCCGASSCSSVTGCGLVRCRRPEHLPSSSEEETTAVFRGRDEEDGSCIMERR